MNWYNSIYPKVSDRMLVFWDDQTPEDADAIAKEIEKTAGPLGNDPSAHWFLLAEDLHAMELMLPESWVLGASKKYPLGGFPRNVWIGTKIANQVQADERLPLLMKLRARRLFVYSIGDVALDEHFVHWRCPNCGRRGYEKRPDSCPSGNLCSGEKLGPQIHWLIDDCASEFLRRQSKTFGVAYWDGVESWEAPQ